MDFHAKVIRVGYRESDQFFFVFLLKNTFTSVKNNFPRKIRKTTVRFFNSFTNFFAVQKFKMCHKSTVATNVKFITKAKRNDKEARKQNISLCEGRL
jgi:hypothetical protein